MSQKTASEIEQLLVDRKNGDPLAKMKLNAVWGARTPVPQSSMLFNSSFYTCLLGGLKNTMTPIPHISDESSRHE